MPHFLCNVVCLVKKHSLSLKCRYIASFSSHDPLCSKHSFRALFSKHCQGIPYLTCLDVLYILAIKRVDRPKSPSWNQKLLKTFK